MVKYIKRFETVTAQTQYIQSMNYIEPYISAVNDIENLGDNVQYNQYNVNREQYTMCNYIRATGSQYINTNIALYPTSLAEMKCRMNTFGAYWDSLFGMRKTSDGGVRFTARFGNSANSKLGVQYSNTNSAAQSAVDINVYKTNTCKNWTIIKFSHIVEVNGTTYKTYTAPASNAAAYGRPLFLCAVNNGGSPIDYCHCDIAYFKLYNVNRECVWHGIPVIRNSDSVYGLLNIINNVFYPSNSSTPFQGG